MATELSSRLAVFYGLASRLSIREVRVGGLTSFYPYASTTAIVNAMKIVGFEGDMNRMIKNLRVIRKCIVDGGVFSFESRKVGDG